MVPLSWFFVQFIITLSSLFTYGVLSLPFDIFPEKHAELLKDDKPIACQNFTIDVTADMEHFFSPKDIKKCEGSTLSIKSLVDSVNSNGMFGIMSVYTFGVMQIGDMSKLTITDT